MLKHDNRQEMTYEHAAQIVNDLLDVFQLLFTPSIQDKPVLLSVCKESGLRRITTITLNSQANTRKTSYSRISENDKYFIDNLYKFRIYGRYFEITLFDNPDDCGYCSTLPDYNPFTYVLCNIEEKRANGTKKYEMAFGFDIEKKTFLELFELIHYNLSGTVRVYPDYNTPLENQLRDTVIIL